MSLTSAFCLNQQYFQNLDSDLVIFIAYYSPEQYKLLLQLADDRKKLDDKWEDWMFNFLKAKMGLQEEFEVQDFHVDVQKMHDYFKSKKLKNTGRNRANYAREEGAKAYEKRINNLPPD